MRILHLSTWKLRCGIADFTENIVSSLARQEITSDVYPLNTAALKHSTTLELREELDRFLRRAAGFDLIHIQHELTLFAGSGGLFESIWNFAYLLSGLYALRCRVVVTFHTDPDFSSMLTVPEHAGSASGLAMLQAIVRRLRTRRVAGKLQNLWRKRVACFFDGRPGSFRGLVHTPRTRLGMLHSGLAPQCVSVMPMGHVLRDPSFLNADRAQAKARLGLESDSILLTIFGFVTAYKGHLLAVQALKKLPPRYHLAIVGGPNLANAGDMTLNSVLETWEDEDPRRLLITGFAPRETIDLYHAATDICLAPFLPGNISGSASATWALTSGKPTIASNIPAFSEIQLAADCLSLCTPNAAHELAWCIEQLAADAGRQQNLARRALDYARENSWDRIIERLIGVYREVAGLSALQPAKGSLDPEGLKQAA